MHLIRLLRIDNLGRSANKMYIRIHTINTFINLATGGIAIFLLNVGCSPQAPLNLSSLDLKISKARQLCSEYLDKGKESDEDLRNSLDKIGVQVLNTSGCYIVSRERKRDGENIIELKDATGRLFVKDMIEATESNESSESVTSRYQWRNTGDPVARAKIARAFLIKKWNWIIYSVAYEEELRNAK